MSRSMWVTLSTLLSTLGTSISGQWTHHVWSPVLHAEVSLPLKAEDGRVKLPVDAAQTAGASHRESGQEGLNLLPHGGGQLVFPDKLLQEN